jgi:hypothetical protein
VNGKIRVDAMLCKYTMLSSNEVVAMLCKYTMLSSNEVVEWFSIVNQRESTFGYPLIGKVV